MENIDIIIVASVSFLLVVGGLFIGMYFARRTEASRVALLDEREERLLAMRAKFEHERFAVAATGSDDDVTLDEDMFRGIKEEIEQERLEIDMRREELELDLRMLEEENDRLKSRLGILPARNADDDDVAEDATIVEVTEDDDVIEAVEIEVDDAPDHASDDAPDDAVEVDTAETEASSDRDDDEAEDLPIARNTVFGAFNFDEDEESVEPVEASAAVDESSEAREDGTDQAVETESAESADPVDDGWSSEPDEIDEGSSGLPLAGSVGGDGAAVNSLPERAGNRTAGERIEPARPAFDHMLTADEERPADGSIQQVLGLSDSDLALMHDLGYGTFRSIADLSDEEIERLAEAFDIPESTIRDEWIPDSRAHVARKPRA